MPDFEIFRGNTKTLLKNFKHDNIIFVYLILVAIVIGIIIASSIMFYLNQQNSEVIQSGVFIKGINVLEQIPIKEYATISKGKVI